MRKWIIKQLGGWTGEEILMEAVRDLYNTIGEDDILKIEGGKWTNAGREISDAEKKLIISDARLFLNSRLWKVLKNDIKYRANLAMFEKAKTEIDITAGKLWLYTLNCIETKLNQITS